MAPTRFEAGGDDRGDGDERLGARRTAQQNARARLDIEFASRRQRRLWRIELREGERRAALLAMIGERRSLGTQTRGAGDQRVEAEHREWMRPRIVGVFGRRGGGGVRPREVLLMGSLSTSCPGSDRRLAWRSAAGVRMFQAAGVGDPLIAA